MKSNVTIDHFEPYTLVRKYSEDQPRDDQGRWTATGQSELSQKLNELTPHDLTMNDDRRGELYRDLMNSVAGDTLEEAVRNWTRSDYDLGDIAINAGWLLEGKVHAEPGASYYAKTLLIQLQRTSMSDPLYRGDSMDHEGASYKELRVGNTIDIPLTSATFSNEIAKEFAVEPGPRGTDYDRFVLYTFEGEKRGIPIGLFSQFPHENEVIVGGRFEVVGVTELPSTYDPDKKWTHVTLRQTGDLNLDNIWKGFTKVEYRPSPVNMPTFAEKRKGK